MRCIVVGGNAAGMSVAAKLMRTKENVALVVYEQSGIVSFGSCGLPYYIGDFFTDHTYMFSRSVESFRQSGIDVRLHHTVTAIDVSKRTIAIIDDAGHEIEDSYDVLIIATGASAIKPPIEGSGKQHIYTLRNLGDGQAIKACLSGTGEHAVVVGAGFIGLEIAEALHAQGKKVRLIELEDRALKAAVGPEVSQRILKELEDKGVEVSLSERVVAFGGADAVSEVVTDKGTYPADLVILSLGIRPNTKFLSNTGLKMLTNGAIVVDGHGKTSIDNIYAVGDCAAVPHLITGQPTYAPLATTANKLGRVIGDYLGGEDRAYPGTLLSSCVKVFDLEIARCGITVEVEGSSSVTITDKNHTNYFPGQEDILLKLVFDMKTRRIVGAEIAGKNGAVLRLNAFAIAIQKESTIDDLSLADFCYAPPFSRTWDVMNVAGNVAVSKCK